MTRPRAVFFDLGKVLCDFDWTRSLRRLAERVEGHGEREIVDWLLGATGPHDPYCRGEIDEAELLAALHERLDPERRLDDGWLLELWCDMFEPIEGALELVDALGGQCHRGLISNTNRLHFEHLDRRCALRHRFESLTLSHEVGVLKPEAPIFRSALRAAEVSAAESFFVDDIGEYAAAAQALGLRAARFEGIEALANSLRAMGFSLPR